MTFREEILEILKKYKSELDEGFLQNAWKGHIGKQEYGQFESYVAYCIVREYKPEIIVEVGCASGYSSYPLALGIQKNYRDDKIPIGRWPFGKYRLYSFETNMKRAKEANDNLRRIKSSDCYHTIEPFDVRTHIYQYIEDTNIDLLFMDADHSSSFCKWYLKELVPRTSKLLHVHDVYYGEPPMGEATEILAWLEQHPQYEWVKTKDISNDFGMDKVLDNDPVGSKNSGIWVKLS